MDDHRKFKSLLTKYCSPLRSVAWVQAAIGKKHIQVSIGAIYQRKSKRLAKFIKRIKRLERDLKKTFPRRNAEVHIWSVGKKQGAQKVSKPFRGRNITIITAPMNL